MVVVLGLGGSCGAPPPADSASADGTASGSSPATTDGGGDDGAVNDSGGNPDVGGTMSSDADGDADDGADDTGSSDGTDGGEKPGQCGRRGGRLPTEFEPNRRFENLAAGEALDLGLYECADRMPQIADACRKITDFSRINYDPYMHRVLMFGGGHSASGRTDVDVLSLDTLTWQSMYPSMSCEEVSAGNLDPRGFHIDTGHPVARHTYDQSVVVEVDGAGQLLLLSTEGFAGYCHPYNSTIQSVAYLPLDGCETWSYSPQFEVPWAYATNAEYDPVSGMVIIIGNYAGASPGGMWVYDPGNHEIVTYENEVPYAGIDGNLVYHPPTDRMFNIQSDASIWEVTLDREDWSATTAVLRAPGGSPPQPPEGVPARNFAYDAHAEIIGGAIRDGVFYAYDPVADTWCAEPIVSVSDEAAEVGSTRSHALDYDPVNNVYLFLDGHPEMSGWGPTRTWAYRFRE